MKVDSTWNDKDCGHVDSKKTFICEYEHHWYDSTAHIVGKLEY